jgi:hypothetical protein
MERDHLPPIRDVPEEVETLTMDQIEVKSYVGGLLKSIPAKGGVEDNWHCRPDKLGQAISHRYLTEA